MKLLLDISMSDLLEQIGDADLDHDEMTDFIMELDGMLVDYGFTLNLVRRLIKSLRESEDPREPLTMEEVWRDPE